MKPIRIFISSVQKELELERAAVAGLISTDPFLLQHCEPILFEKEPPPPRPSIKPYLAALKGCQAYVLMIANEYGGVEGEISATHHEYRLAQDLKLPTVVFIKGSADGSRSPEVKKLIGEVKKHGFTYKRFHDREDLRPLMMKALRRMLSEAFALNATSDEVAEGEQQVEAASPFETTILTDILVDSLDHELLNRFKASITADTAEVLFSSGGAALHARGLAVSSGIRNQLHPSTGAFILFAPRPANKFPQCDILADAYDGQRITGHPKGQASINAPLPLALEQILKFVDDHTFHPYRTVELNNLRLDEYPTAALREALVNAVAHRDYQDASRKIFVRVFSNRIEIASPGYPLKPLTPARLRRGGYRPCSRNPLISQTLASLSLMEQRGTGFARMRDAMLNHGLTEPEIEQQDGFFVIKLVGPNGDFDRIKTPKNLNGQVTPAIEARLNERQKRIFTRVLTEGKVTRGWCVAEFGVANDTAGRDLRGLTELGLLVLVGNGRSTHYISKTIDKRSEKS